MHLLIYSWCSKFIVSLLNRNRRRIQPEALRKRNQDVILKEKVIYRRCRVPLYCLTVYEEKTLFYFLSNCWGAKSETTCILHTNTVKPRASSQWRQPGRGASMISTVPSSFREYYTVCKESESKTRSLPYFYFVILRKLSYSIFLHELKGHTNTVKPRASSQWRPIEHDEDASVGRVPPFLGVDNLLHGDDPWKRVSPKQQEERSTTNVISKEK